LISLRLLLLKSMVDLKSLAKVRICPRKQFPLTSTQMVLRVEPKFRSRNQVAKHQSYRKRMMILKTTKLKTTSASSAIEKMKTLILSLLTFITGKSVRCLQHAKSANKSLK